MRVVSYVYAFDDNNALRVRFELERGRVLSFVVQLECYFVDHGWLPVVRYDTAHGFAHRDTIHPRREAEKKAMPVGSYEEGLSFAENDLKSNWREYRRRYEEWLEK
ncbi:MAG: hypothetical protein H3C52_11495 [Anaerolineales bacterium]|nr:hypothetical protein [Anaerolineales bacterium]MCZ2290100.1 hypothetical protein [Anaerolineales bacterium]